MLGSPPLVLDRLARRRHSLPTGRSTEDLVLTQCDEPSAKRCH